jgi:hypothetical protein
MEPTQQNLQRIFTAWNQYQMDVVGHQAPRQHAGFRGCQVPLQQPEVGSAIAGGKEDALMVSPPLGNVISHFRDDTTCISGDSEERVSAGGQNSPICGSAPTCWWFSPTASVRLTPSLKSADLERKEWVPVEVTVKFDQKNHLNYEVISVTVNNGEPVRIYVDEEAERHWR